MMFLLNKTFLSLDDLAYIFNQHGFNVDLDNPKQDKKFLTSLRDLMHESKLTPLFFYDGTISNLDGSNGQHYRGYFIYDSEAISHFINSKRLSIVTCKPYNAYFRYDEKKPYRLNQPNASNLAIYFHRAEVEKLFQSNVAIEAAMTTEHETAQAQIAEQQKTIEQLQQTNAELAEQLATIDRQAQQIAELEAQIIEQQKTIEQLTQQAGEPSQNGEVTDEPLKGIEKVNYDKAKAKAFACTIAAALWRMDTKQKIKTGKMAELLKAMLIDFDPTVTPETSKTIKEWIKPNAPEYAKKSGRPSNNNDEIILTFK